MKNHKKSQNKEYELTDTQLQAINLLVMGHSITETAKHCDVTRETVSRWKNGNVDFIAAYNAARNGLHDEIAQSLVNLRKQATAALESILGTLVHKVESGERVDFVAVAKIANDVLKLTDKPIPELKTDRRDVQLELDTIEKNAGVPETWQFDF